MGDAIPSPPPLAPPYSLVRLLGAGAAGEVYLVANERERRYEALKVLKPQDGEMAGMMATMRFKREALVAQMLVHQNIVATYDSGVLADGRLFLTMEYVEGRSLDALLHERGPLPVPTALGILAEVADALFHAHRANVIHRDIKPHNLVLAPHPNGSIVRVLDFGIAKIIGPDNSHDKLVTAKGAVFGTPEYMSPEQIRSAAIDSRTDTYSLGCVGYALLTGDPPFRGSLAMLLAQHVKAPPRPPSALDPGAIPPEVDAVILRCLAKRPEDRFQSGAELCAAIHALPHYRPLRVPPPLA